MELSVVNKLNNQYDLDTVHCSQTTQRQTQWSIIQIGRLFNLPGFTNEASAHEIYSLYSFEYNLGTIVPTTRKPTECSLNTPISMLKSKKYIIIIVKNPDLTADSAVL